MFRPPYPSESYLLRAEKRYRWRDAAGRIDADALARTVKLLPTAPELTPDQRTRLGQVLDRVQKAAASFSEIAAGGMLDERFGFPIIVEVPEGGTRRGESEDGTPWESVFTGASYGFLPDTVARDAEEIDVIAGPRTDAPNVYIVTFLKPVPENLTSDGAVIDEIKLFIGFGDYEAAQACARANWPPERIGSIQTMPIEVLRGLLGFELDEGIVQKAIGMAAHGGLVVTSPSGIVIGRVEKCLPKDTTLAVVNKGAISVATFEPGGIRLFSQGKPRMMRGKLCEELHGTAARIAKALDSTTAYQGHTQHIDERPELEDHPAKSAPLTWEYEDPSNVGGWIGAIEPIDESWICFVDVNGRALLWLQREADGGVIGEPIEFKRPDLMQSLASTAKTLEADVLGARDERIATTIATVHLCAVEKGLDAATPIDRRIVYGVVLEPEPFGGRGDGHDETYGTDVIRRAAYNWLASFANFDDSHGRFLSKQEIVPVESFIAPIEFMHNGTVIQKGAWVVGAKIVSDVLWGRVLSGELTAWSIEGYALRECTTCNARMKSKQLPDGQKQWLCPNCDRLALLLP